MGGTVAHGAGSDRMYLCRQINAGYSIPPLIITKTLTELTRLNKFVATGTI
jgi:hypothetical protein